LWVTEDGRLATAWDGDVSAQESEDIRRRLAMLSDEHVRDLRRRVDDAVDSVFEEFQAGRLTVIGHEELAPTLAILKSYDWALMLAPPFDLSSLEKDSVWGLDILMLLDEVVP
jgi:hypothetical protein